MEIERDKEIQKEYDADQNKVVEDSCLEEIEEERQTHSRDGTHIRRRHRNSELDSGTQSETVGEVETLLEDQDDG